MNGDVVDVQEERVGWHENEDGKFDFDDISEESGRIREEDELVYWTEEEDERILGIRLTEDLIAYNYLGEEYPEDIAYINTD